MFGNFPIRDLSRVGFPKELSRCKQRIAFPGLVGKPISAEVVLDQGWFTQEFLSGWNANNRIKLIIDNTNIDKDLMHFPIPIVLETTSGQDSQDLSVVFDELGTNSKKIAITKSDGITEIYGEIENWDATNERAVIWVSKSDLELLKAGVTVLYFYYDSEHVDNSSYIGDISDIVAQNVWDSNFKAVYHMAQDPSGGADAILDSTLNGNHGTPAGTMLTEDLIDGEIGKAIDFDGTDDYIDLGTSPSIIGTGNFTFEAVVKSSSATQQVILNQRILATATPSFIFRIASTGYLDSYLYDSGVQQQVNSSSLDLADGDEHYAVSIRDSVTSMKQYVDGVVDGTDSGGTAVSLTEVDVHIGRHTGASSYLLGLVAELRISDMERTAAWIKATHHTLQDNLLTYDQGMTTWANRIKFTIDSKKITEDLTHFPFPIIINEESGLGGLDLSQLFEDLNYTDDTFTGINGEFPNTDAWVNSGDDNAVINDNKLRFSISGGSTAHDNCIIDSLFTMGGTDDFSIDFDSSPINQPATDSSYFYFKIVNASDDTDFCYFSRFRSASLLQFRSGQVVNGSSVGSVTTTTAVSFSKWRVTRESGDIKFWYYDTAWNLHHTVSGTTYPDFTGEISLRFQLFSYVGFPALTWDIDNFVINSGTILWSENTNPNRRKFAIFKADGISQLYGEIETYNDIDKKIVIWVGHPDFEISKSEDTVLWLCWDKDKTNLNYIGYTAEENTLDVTGDIFTGNDDDSPNRDLWESILGDSEIQSNKLQQIATQSSTQTNNQLNSVFRVTGDFNIQLDFTHNFSATADSSALFMIILDDNNSVYVQIVRSTSLFYYAAWKKVAGTTTQIGSNTTTTDTSETFQITQVSGTITCVGGGNTLGTCADFANTTKFIIRCQTFNSVDFPTFQVDFDNFLINSGTVISIPSNHVWDADFKAVYHMAQDPNGDVADSILDSTSNENHGTPDGTMLTEDLIDGLTGKAIDFDGTDDFINLGTFNPSSVDLSLEIYCNIDVLTADMYFFTKRDSWSASDMMWQLFYSPSLTSIVFGNFSNNTASQQFDFIPPINKNFYLALTHDDVADDILYANGISKDSHTSLVFDSDTTAGVSVVCRIDGTGAIDMFVGEVRFSDIVRSAAWVKATNFALINKLITFFGTK